MQNRQGFIRIWGVLGSLLFLPLFIFTYSDPHLVEKTGRQFIEWRLQLATNDKIDAIQLPQATKLESFLGKKAQVLRQKTQAKLDELKAQLKADSPAILAEQLAQMIKLDCDCRQQWQQKLRQIKVEEMVKLELARVKLVNFTQAKYMEIVTKLTLDIRIFLGSNAVVFLLLLLLSFARPQTISHLILPAVLLGGSTLIASYFYLFEQNWFFTIIYDDYTGFAFLGYIVLVFLLLSDIAFNRARVTTEILNALISLGSKGTFLTPC